jgi:tetratricopeptide (TPR) repeat protein/DNA-binding winged helix-turn-helix (wHTH) protein
VEYELAGLVGVRKRLLDGFFLGDFRIEPLTGTVKGSGVPIHLPSKSVEVLLTLANAPRAVVTREDLLSAAWGDGEGSQAALSHAISTLRQALQDHADNPRFIQTLPRRGYRLLVAPNFSDEVPGAAMSDASPTGFVEELKQRGVIETAIAYFVVGWLLIQIADATFDQLPLPVWARPFLTYLVIAGFPIALLLAWFIEITSRGAVIDSGARGRRRRLFSHSYVSVIGGLVLASVGVFAFDRYVGLPVDTSREQIGDGISDPTIVADVEPNSIAVLRLFNIDGTERTQIFGDGLAEDLINRLVTVAGLKVSSRGDSFALPPNSLSSDVRRRLRVAHYFEGSVRIAQDRLRVVLQLIESAEGTHRVSRSFDRQVSDFFELQDEITDYVMAELKVALPGLPDLDAPYTRGEADLDAYYWYRRGREILYSGMSEASVAEAVSAFERSLSVDPDYAAAYAGLCETYAAAYDVTSDTEYISLAEQSCGSALRLNANLSVVHNALGEIYSRTGRYEDAEREYEQTLAFEEDSVEALLGLGDVYLSQGRHDEAEAKYRQGIGLQPGNWRPQNSLGRLMFQTGHYPEAVRAYRAIVTMEPENDIGWSNVATALMLSGNFTDALEGFERALDLEPGSRTLVNIGLLHYYLGNGREAIRVLREAIDRSPNDHLAWSNLGDAHTFYGDPTEAAEAFRTAERLAREKLDINPKDFNLLIDLAWIVAMRDRLDEAMQYVMEAMAIEPSDPYVHYIDALILTRAGQTEAALDALALAIESGHPRAIANAEPHLGRLRDEARFGELVGE